MAEKRLVDFKSNGGSLLFSFPLYTKVKVNSAIETTDDSEILDYDEEGIPNILHHIYFKENRDFRFLKKLVIEEHNFFYYCPFCSKEVPIIYKGKIVHGKYKDSILSTYSYMYSMTEEFEDYKDSATENFSKRYQEFTNEVFGENKTLQMNLECTSKHKHKFYAILQLTDDNYLIKTGQYPSILDFDNSLREYKNVLKNKDISKELNNATILITHNMGVGAFLYLRRIFEKLIFEQFDKAKSEHKIDEQKFREAKTKEKVSLLYQNGYVPSFLAEINPFLYDILSKGVHELEEQECKLHYNILRDAILLILEEKIDMEKKEKLKEFTKNKLNTIHAKLSQ
ncbi:hypothetical protein AK95_19625 [Paenibacillus sp. LC231]|uniref:hypothetical protein n=1 Tax=Paenibacillus sp. LC231 TaxID=1120679 RepID=UPI0008DCC44C|nr:hypothetical protein [Paenibacillus sp. LC231]OIA99373.1 hypothetical protein AK95_19625 [Paenibacillus sp. LC231]